MLASETKLTPEELAYGRILFWRVVMAATLVFWGLGLYQVGVVAQARALFETSLKWRLAGYGGLGLAVLILAVFVISFTPLYIRIYGLLRAGFTTFQRAAWLNLLVALAGAACFSILLYGSYGFLFENLWARISLLWLVGLPAGLFLRAAVNRSKTVPVSWTEGFVAGMMLLMVVYKVAGYLPEITTYPLTLGWSEASRYYYASLFFSERLYGLDLAKPFLHPTRYLLQSIPFLAPDLPLIAHRLWQVILWVGMTALTSGLLVRRLALPTRFMRWAVGAWAFLFLFQGPVYYHLLVPVAIVLAGFRSDRFWRSLVVIAVASLWAGISRINWFPVPAFLAAAIYLLETPYSTARGLLDYLRRPFWWGVAGGLSAFAAQAVYILVSGNQDAKSFGSSFTSDLLWYRLWPSPTYGPGIFPMMVVLSLPVLLVILLTTGRRMHWLRLLGLGAMLLALFAGGQVVSTKIGGGSNLHNMDAYLVLLLIWGTWMAFQRAAPEAGAEQLTVGLLWPALLLAAIMPFYPLLREGAPFQPRDHSLAWEDTREIQARVDAVTARGGRVLFISQRHLLTFGIVSGVPLEAPYETVELMEMAMSGNPDYLNQFYQDLSTHRFDLIVTGEQNVVIKGAQDSFPEENNVWVERVSIPLLEHYQSAYVLPYSHLQFLEPKP